MGLAREQGENVRAPTGAVASQAAVVSVDFPRSPEARFPTALEDCYAAMQYLAEHGIPVRIVKPFPS